ncbi:MAG: excinuclease ABC subunit UvrC [Patescibacteria group bacterium]
MSTQIETLYERFPETPGVYLMKDARGGLLYIGKAANLKRRVSSYFLRPHDYRVKKMVSKIRSIDYQKTDTALEALILEAKLIKKYQPPYNILEKDDKSFLFVEITKEPFSRVLLVRGKEKKAASGIHYGPFISGASIREALRILRRIFPWNMHPDAVVSALSKPCFDHQIGLCPGTCMGTVSKRDYAKTIRGIQLIFEGKKERIIKILEGEMNRASKALEFEKAAKLRGQIFSLKHIQDVALIRDADIRLPGALPEPSRIEGYDISNLSGDSAVGSMVVFTNGKANQEQYRKFKIRTFKNANDVGMLKEVFRRRFRHNEWPLPTLMLIDGGKGQVNAGREALDEAGFRIPIVGIAKGPKRKKNEFIGTIPGGISEKTLIRARDEAHRFAITYHRALRGARSLQ